jgi:hypothetical protein
MTAKERQLQKVIALIIDYLSEHEPNGFLRAVNLGLVSELTLLLYAHGYSIDAMSMDEVMGQIRRYKEQRELE